MATFDVEQVHVHSSSSSMEHPAPPGDMWWYKAHGVMLYSAFSVLFPLGVLGVRYGRYHVRFRHWFQYHWVLQTLGVSLTTGAISIALRQFENTRHSTHGYIGYVLAFTILFQPILALFRPDKEDDLRPCWEFAHWFIGTGGIVLGWVNIFKGLDLYFVVWPAACSQLILTILFSVQVSFIGFTYLLFDRCHREPPCPPDPCPPDEDDDDNGMALPLLKKASSSSAVVRDNHQFLTRV